MIDTPHSSLFTANKNDYIPLPAPWDGIVLIEKGIGLIEIPTATDRGSEFIGLQLVVPGQWIGAACLYARPEKDWAIRAITDNLVVRHVAREAYQRYLDCLSPPMRDRAVKTSLVDTAHTLHASHRILTMVRDKSSDQRVLWAVEQISQAVKITTGDSNPVIRVGREVVSSLSITTPETVSRSISTLVAKGLIEQVPPRGLRLVRNTAT